MEIKDARNLLKALQEGMKTEIEVFEKNTGLVVEHLEVVRDDNSNLQSIDADVMLVAE